MASSGAPLFRAVTKDAVPPADSKGTLTAFWNKKKEKVTDEVVDLVDDVPMEEAEPLGQNVEVTPEGPQQLVVATGEAAAAECTAEKLGDASVAPEAPEALEQPKDQVGNSKCSNNAT